MTMQLHTTAEPRWAAGAEVRLGPHPFLLRAPVDERTAADRSWVWREATAEVSGGRRVRLRQVALRRLGRRGAQLRDGLGVQADLLSIVAGDRGLPRLVGRHDEAGRTTLVTELPAAPSWRDGFGPGGRSAPLDRLTAAATLAAAGTLCAALAELHRHGQAHRALGPDTVLLLDRYRRAVPRDLGLAGFTPTAGEGPGIYRAPEQYRAAEPGSGSSRLPGPATDVYQTAALIYHTLTGRRPGPAPNPPVRAAVAGFPAGSEGVIAAALAAAPALRPGIAALSDALGAARAALAAG
jgi:hypothetical protein